MGGAIYYLKIKVYSVSNPKFGNVFDVFPKLLFPDYRGDKGDVHSVFIEKEFIDEITFY